MNRTIEDIQKDIELLGIKGGYDIEQLLTPQDCRRLSYEIERLNNIIKEAIEYVEESYSETVDGIEGIAKFFSKREEILLKILKRSESNEGVRTI